MMKLWQPTLERIEQSNLKQFEQYAAQIYSRSFADYQALWRWSIDEKEQFWQCLAEFFNVIFLGTQKIHGLGSYIPP